MINTDNNYSTSTPDSTSEASQPRLLPLSALLAEFDDAARAGYEAKQAGRLLGPSTGFPNIDREIGGSLQPGLHIAHGVPGVGKSAFALQIAATCGCPSLFVTCEMTPLELLRRITARVTKTYLGKFKNYDVTPADAMDKVRAAIRETPNLTLLDATNTPTTRKHIENAADTIQQNADGQHLLIVVDSLHSWVDGWGSEGSEYDRLNAGLTSLRQMAASLKCPILAIAERNRQSMRGGGMSAGAGTRKIEYGSETVFDLSWTKDGKNSDEPAEAPPVDGNGEVPLVVTLSKNRHGTPGKSVPLRFHGGFQRYAEETPR